MPDAVQPSKAQHFPPGSAWLQVGAGPTNPASASVFASSHAHHPSFARFPQGIESVGVEPGFGGSVPSRFVIAEDLEAAAQAQRHEEGDEDALLHQKAPAAPMPPGPTVGVIQADEGFSLKGLGGEVASITIPPSSTAPPPMKPTDASVVAV